jgi:hypothetical protein
MANNNDLEENTFAIIIAVISTLMSPFILFLVTRPMARILQAPWNEWLLAPLFTLVPMGFAFIILYHSAWHLEWSGLKRILLSLLLSCVIFGADALLVCYLALICSFAGNCLLRGG